MFLFFTLKIGMVFSLHGTNLRDGRISLKRENVTFPITKKEPESPSLRDRFHFPPSDQMKFIPLSRLIFNTVLEWYVMKFPSFTYPADLDYKIPLIFFVFMCGI